MINKSLFSKILEEHQRYNQGRDEIIQRSREVLRKSKQAIFSLHRDDIEQAEANIGEAEAILKDLQSLFVKEPRLAYEGSYKAGVEEYLEAVLFLGFLKTKKIDCKVDIPLAADDYVGGLSDVTGEILRKAVQVATAGKTRELLVYKEAVEEIMGELIKFDFTGKLRTKYDAAKRNLKKMEDIMYDIKIKK